MCLPKIFRAMLGQREGQDSGSCVIKSPQLEKKCFGGNNPYYVVTAKQFGKNLILQVVKSSDRLYFKGKLAVRHCFILPTVRFVVFNSYRLLRL